jgi:hypothetical protein
MTQSCDDEAAEVTGWPIDQIQAAIQPNPDQSALLDDSWQCRRQSERCDQIALPDNGVVYADWTS